jgi:hypothetical protein
MGVGFEAYTDSGLFQIDGIAPNMTLRQIIGLGTSPGALPITWTQSGLQGPVVPVAAASFEATAPLVALYSPYTAATVISTTNNGGDIWTVEVWSLDPATVFLYIFDSVAAVGGPGGSGYGFQVFDSNAGLIYDARRSPVSILDFVSGNIMGQSPYTFQGNLAWPGNRQQVYSYPVAKVATAAILNAADRSTQQYFACSAWVHSGGSAVFQFLNINQGDKYPPNNWTGFASAMQCDLAPV